MIYTQSENALYYLLYYRFKRQAKFNYHNFGAHMSALTELHNIYGALDLYLDSTYQMLDPSKMELYCP